MNRRRPLPLVLALVTLISVACGIPRDEQPVTTPGGVVFPAVAPTDAAPPVGPSRPEADVAVFLVKAEQLVQVVRSTGPTDLTGALNALLAGPTEAELAAGIRTAISPQTDLRSAHLEGDTAVVDLSGSFVEVGGQEQILAVAQVVLTATAVPTVGRVRFLLEGQGVEIPRADGTLSSESLGRADYQGLLSAAP